MEIFVIREGQQTGPFKEEDIQKLLKSGGLKSEDMGWRKGLPGWLPLGEVMNPGSERPSAPPPAPGMSGIRSVSGISKNRATNKQKALLKYIGASFEEDITKQEAAEAISEALENPRLTPRFTKWGEEKLRLHPDYFQDEIDYRRANRVARFVELCETEGADAVKGVTKAHVQVLVESLDKKTPKWDADPKDALWNGLLPAIAEHFPQLIQEDWKERLKPEKKGSGRAPTRAAVTGEPAPSAIGAALRGIIYGVVLLGVILGGIHFLSSKGDSQSETKTANSDKTKTPTAAPKKTDSTALPPFAGDLPPQAPAVPASPGIPALSTPEAPATPPANTVAAVPTGEPPAAPMPAPTVAPAPAPAPLPLNPEPAPTAPAAPTLPTTPAAPVANVPASPKNVVTIMKPVAVQLQFGKVTLNPGTKMRLIAVEGANVRVNFNNNVILVPLAATDTDPNAPTPAPTPAPVPLTTPTAPAPAPTATTPGAPPLPKPSSDL